MLLGKMRGWLGLGAPQGTSAPAPRAAAERVWGTGFLGPADAAEISRLIAPMRTAPGMSFLLVNDGGTAVPDVIAATGASVTPFTTDRALARRTGQQYWDRAVPEFGNATFARALAIEPLGGAAADRVLVALAAAIMPVGQLMLVELVADEAFDPADPAVTRWLEITRRDAPPPTAAQICRALGRLGFALQTVQDLSEHHVWQARQGWNAAMERLAAIRLAPAERVALEAEGERWRARLRLLTSGQLRLICWHAVGKAPLV